MKHIFKGMANDSIDTINNNFDELADPNRDVTANDLNINGKIKSKLMVKTISVGKLTGTIMRSGNSVSLSIENQPWPYGKGSPWTGAYDMNIPAGFRPAKKTTLSFINNYVSGTMILMADGWMAFTDTGVNDSTQFELYGNWQTNDDFPE